MSLVAKISKLLAKAEGTDSSAEAEVFFSKAQELCAQHSIDMAVAYKLRESEEALDVIEERTLKVGEPRSQGLKQKVLLWGKIANANNLRYSIAHNSSTVYPIGFSTDLDLAESLWGVLAEQMVRFCNLHLDAETYKLEGIDKRVARRSFYEGFIDSVGIRLMQAKNEVEQQRIKEDRERDATLPSVTSLALVDRKQAVNDFTTRAFHRKGVRGSWNGPSSGYSSYSSRVAGGRAGSEASLSGRSAINA